MMKKYYSLLAIAAVAAMVACNKNSAPAIEEPVDETPVAIEFGLGQPAYTLATKSVGGVDAWTGHELYVLGYRHEHGVGINDFSLANAIIPNIMATATYTPSGDPSIPADTGTAVLDVRNPEAPSLDGLSYEPYYYQGDYVYEFYGYHVDDAYNGGEANPTPIVVTETTAQADGTSLSAGVYVPFMIDGSQDLMVGRTDKAADILNTNVTDTSKVYGAYAARRKVQPTLNFSHKLARFTFYIQSGSVTGNSVFVDSIAVSSSSKGYLRVIGGDPATVPGIVVAADDVASNLFLQQYDDNTSQCIELVPVKPENAYDPDAASPVLNPAPNKVGESLMIIPGDAEYTLTLWTKMDGVQTKIDPQVFTLKATDLVDDSNANLGATTFEAGKSYKVTIKIYGLEEIKITAALEDWVPGGSVTLDPDA